MAVKKIETTEELVRILVERRRVDLPEPFSPTKATDSPELIERVISLIPLLESG